MQRFLRNVASACAIASVCILGSTPSAWAANSDGCCLVLPPAPANDADGVIRITWGADPLAGLGVPPESSFATIDIQNTTAIPAGRYASWCFDVQSSIDPAPTGTLYGGRLYSTCDPSVAFNASLPPHPGVIQDAAAWKRINYLINHRFVACNGTVPTMWEVQHAILLLFGQTPPPTPPYPNFRASVVQCLVDDANANAAAWQPGCDDKIAVIFDADVNWDAGIPDIQLLFMEVPCSCVCKLSITKECLVPAPEPGEFDCAAAKPIDTLWVRWNGSKSPVWVKAWNGPIGMSAYQVIGPIITGQKVTFSRSGSYPGDVYFEIFGDSSLSKTCRIGVSKFNLACCDPDMNGPEDCGKKVGDGNCYYGYLKSWIFEGMKGNGLVLDCSPLPPAPATTCVIPSKAMAGCDSLGKAKSLTFQYTGGRCNTGDNDQGGHALCLGCIDATKAVTIYSMNGYHLSATTVQPGGEVTLSSDCFDPDSLIVLKNSGGIQFICINTSCKVPLTVGDVFGGLTLVAYNGQIGGSPVTYRYTVKNEGNLALTDVYVTDDKLGAIAGPFALAVGETKTFDVDVQVSDSVTNVATVYVQGKSCAATSNAVVVTVEPNCPVPKPVCLPYCSRQLKWEFANKGANAIVLSGLSVSWPATNGRLLKVKLDGDVVWSAGTAAGVTSLTLDAGALTSNPSYKSISPGDSRTLILEFEKYIATDSDKYSLSVSFGPCVLTL